VLNTETFQKKVQMNRTKSKKSGERSRLPPGTPRLRAPAAEGWAKNHARHLPGTPNQWRREDPPPVRSDAAHRRHPRRHQHRPRIAKPAASPRRGLALARGKAGKGGEMHREVFGQGQGGSSGCPLHPPGPRAAPRLAASSPPQTPSSSRDPPRGCSHWSAYSSPDTSAAMPQPEVPPKTGAEPHA